MALLGKGCVIWFTGLSGAGKTTIADAVTKKLRADDMPVYELDGDVIRTGLCKDLGFTAEDRDENVRRATEVARLFADCGVICICAFISPFKQTRDMAREIIGPDRFFEVHVSTSLEVCERRDTKGLYKKARAGEIPNFTGISSPYEPPDNADVTIDTETTPLEESIPSLIEILSRQGIVPSRPSTT